MPVFTNTPASLRVRRTTRSASATSTTPTPHTALATPAPEAVAATMQPDATAPPSTNTQTSSPLLDESFVTKAQRAFERNRQRTKQRQERKERKERAERERVASAQGGADCRHCRNEGTGAKRSTAARARAGGVVVSDDDNDDDGAVALLSPQVEEIIAEIVQREAQAKLTFASQPIEVHLDELMKPGKPRRSKAGEFELVPGMPVVIALDDQMSDNAELDESWEHISADELDEKRVPPPTYATVVANAV